MSDALWVQASGVSYSAAEDRALIDAVFTAGVVVGLAVSVGSGLQVTVTPGFAAVPDTGNTTKYLASLDSSTNKVVTANQTNAPIYLVVNPTTAVNTLEIGTTPTNPYITLGTYTSNATNVTSVAQSAVSHSEFRGTQGKFLKLAGGGVVTGSTVFDRIVVPNYADGSAALVVDDTNNLWAPRGIRLGFATGQTKRLNVRAQRISAQNIPTSTWTTVVFNQVDRDVSDFGGAQSSRYSTTTGAFIAPVTGSYAFSGRVHITDVAGADANGGRWSRFLVQNSAGATRWDIRCQAQQDTVLNSLTLSGPDYANRTVTRTYLDNPYLWFEASNLDLSLGDHVYFQAYHSQGSTLQVVPGSYSAGTAAWGSFRLLMAD